LTDIGRAAVGADNARAEQARAGAEENRAQADKARRPGEGKAAAASKWTAPSATSFNAAFNNADGVTNQKDYARFNSWRTSSGIANGEEALARWRAEGRPDPAARPARETPPVEERGTVADFNAVPDDELVVVTEETGPRGATMTQIGRAAVPADQRERFDKAGSLLQEARDAIQRGADPAAVKSRLRKMGYSNIAGRL
jgi:hypothetical protein